MVFLQWETLKEYWWCIDQTLQWPDGGGPDLLVDDGGDLTLYIHEGVKIEEEVAAAVAAATATGDGAAGAAAAAAATSLLRSEVVQQQLQQRLAAAETEEEREMVCQIYSRVEVSPFWFKETAGRIKGVSEETTTGVLRLLQREAAGQLLFAAVNVNDCVTKSKFDNVYGCRQSLLDSLMRATGVMLAGKTVVVCGYGEVGKGCAAAVKGQGGRVIVSEVDPICALQACMEGFEVSPLETVVGRGDIFVTCTGNRDVITVEHMLNMKHNAITGERRKETAE
ncbi:adenosylhomocysteinase, putative [Eimeria brunetti]|uniref:Adenosylhomocysteinase, putative n=1 Tax=Eimeria brunetti TaxID=51314 RepID=U6LFH3_9EIME|nr:adenosylhomocysteinase, putative [Eimeria brunetti]